MQTFEFYNGQINAAPLMMLEATDRIDVKRQLRKYGFTGDDLLPDNIRQVPKVKTQTIDNQ